jgi:transcriptional regulator with XRE-family HTH domain
VAFGQVLRDCRGKAGISQEELAARAKVDRTYVSLLERGLRQPTLGTLFRLAQALGVAPATMVSRAASLVEKFMAGVRDQCSEVLFRNSIHSRRSATRRLAIIDKHSGTTRL